ncbi:MAG: response regulator transcription factor [Pyrinomonadaceae bacterium]
MLRPVLIVEDDPDIAENLRYNIEREKLVARIAHTGEEGLAASLDTRNPPLLIILDLMLSGMSGMELCRRLRREPLTRRTPIIMVTARTSETDVVMGLELGADDYLTKPFSVRELMARVRAIMRRIDEGTGSQRYDDGSLRVNFAEMRVACEGLDVKLTRKEFALLEVLIGGAGRVVTRQRLLNEVWGYQHYHDSRTLDVHIRRLRQQLGVCSNSIETVIGVGYRFVGATSGATPVASPDDEPAPPANILS